MVDQGGLSFDEGREVGEVWVRVEREAREVVERCW